MITAASSACVFASPCRTFSQNESRGPTSNGRILQFLNVLKIYTCQLCFCIWPPRVALLDAFSAFSSFFGSFFFSGVLEASVYADMDIETSRLRSALAYLPAFEISKMFSFGAPPPIFRTILRSAMESAMRSAMACALYHLY